MNLPQRVVNLGTQSRLLSTVYLAQLQLRAVLAARNADHLLDRAMVNPGERAAQFLQRQVCFQHR